MNKEQVYEAIKKQAVLPLFYHEDATVAEEVVDALYAGGIRVVEFTNRGPRALANFTHLIEKRTKSWPDLHLAIGTIKTPEQATTFISAGADFIICPGMVPEVGKTVHAAGKVWIPGAMTVSEILAAQALGAGFIKLFPGNLLGPSFMAGIRDIFPELQFMPTGGVELTQENLRAWFNAGVTAVGLGSKFISKELLVNKDYTTIRHAAENALNLVRSVTN